MAVVNGMNEGVSNAGAIIQSIWGESSTAANGGLVYALLYPGPCASQISQPEHVDAALQVWVPVSTQQYPHRILPVTLCCPHVSWTSVRIELVANAE